jgi:hypothetical protein
MIAFSVPATELITIERTWFNELRIIASALRKNFSMGLVSRSIKVCYAIANLRFCEVEGE